MGPPHEHKVVIPRLPLRCEIDIRSIRLAMRSQQLVLAQLSFTSRDESKENATIASTDTEHEVANLHALPHLQLIDFMNLLVPGQLRPLSSGTLKGIGHASRARSQEDSKGTLEVSTSVQLMVV